MDNLYVDEEQLEAVLEKLKSLKIRIQNVYDNQKTVKDKIKKHWNGATGEKVYETLKKHEKEYNSYIDSLDEKIAFIENIREEYKAFDVGVNHKIDEI